MSVVLIAAKEIAQAWIEKIPDLLTRGGQEKHVREMIDRFQYEMHYLVSIVDGIQQRQADALERQQMLAMEAIRVSLTLAHQQLYPPLAAPLPQVLTNNSPEDLLQVLGTAQHQVVVSLQRAGLCEPQMPHADLETLVRWEMTHKRIFQAHNASVHHEEWTLLAYTHEQHVYYLAIAGTSRETARVRYLAEMPTMYPYDETGWQRLLEDSVSRFAQFVELPGTGKSPCTGIEALGDRLELCLTSH